MDGYTQICIGWIWQAESSTQKIWLDEIPARYLIPDDSEVPKSAIIDVTCLSGAAYLDSSSRLHSTLSRDSLDLPDSLLRKTGSHQFLRAGQAFEACSISTHALAEEYGAGT